MANKTNPHNKFIQFLTLSVLLLGLGTSALLVQQKMYNSKAAVQAPPLPVCSGGQFFCGARAGCWPGGCVNTSGRTCSAWLDSYCRTQSTTPRPSTPRPSTPQPTFIPKNTSVPTPVISKICTPYSERCQKVNFIGLDVAQKCRADGSYWDTQSGRWCGDCSSWGLVPDGKSINNTRTCISPYSGNK